MLHRLCFRIRQTDRLLILICLSLPAALCLAAAEAPRAIPLKPDPPPAIDGDLAEWAGVPGAITLGQASQVVHGPTKWSSPADLSATLWLAWRQEHLYLAIDVTDDRLRQTESGENLWKGDHIELYVDADPDAEASRRTLGKGQFHLGFSPGNFGRTGDALADRKPEAVVFTPAGMAAQGVLVAARQTEKGYALEAAVPWSLVGVRPAVGVPLGLEVGVSDTDGDEAVQESLMTISSAKWVRTRDRLVACVLSAADGKAPPVVRGIDIFPRSAAGGGLIELAPDQKSDVRFDTPRTPEGREAVLSLRARLVTDRPAGYTNAMELTLNGKPLDASRLVNKKAAEERVDGTTQSMAAGTQLVVGYAPDFDSPDRDPHYGLRRAKVCRFDLRVTDLLREGSNTLVIRNSISHGLKNPLIVADGRLELRSPAETPKKKGPPAGPLPVCAPTGVRVMNLVHESRDGTPATMVIPAGVDQPVFTVRQIPDGTWHVSVSPSAMASDGTVFAITSEFSTPEPNWQRASNRFFAFQRQIERRDEAIVIRDTFTNLTDQNLPLMQRHRASIGGGSYPWKQVWLAGLSPASKVGTSSHPENPTVFATTDRFGIGLMPLDDVFQVHVTNFSDGRAIGLADNTFVLKPKATHTAEWAIVLTAEPDYFAFVNAARRLRDVNFTMDGTFVFLRADPTLTGKWTDKQLTDFARLKDARWLCSSIDYPRYKGDYPHGTAFQTLDHSYRKQHIARLRGLMPDVKHLVYFHCYIDVLDGSDRTYADARLLRSDGTQANYGQPQHKIFTPIETNDYGRNVAKNVDVILDQIGSDGVYWDELEYSAYQYHYGLPWDGVSADIDPKTMKITRLKSSVTLISQPWRIALARKILARGPLVGNGAPHTRTMAQLHFPRFVETGSISNCTGAQLFTPLALGDHLTERSELDAYQVMLSALDYGCVYAWYNDVTVIPTHAHLTRYMFPITPVELHEGYIIGRERIITNRSGLFGWGDPAGTCADEVHVFNDDGREVPAADVPKHAKAIVRNGKAFTELRVAEGWSAVIVRSAKK